jgi:hypothetical protein
MVILLLAVALSVAWSGFGSRTEAESALADLGGQRATLATRIQMAEAKIAQGGREHAAIQAVREKPPSFPPELSPLAESARKSPGEATLLIQNPELSALYAKSLQAGLSRRYGPIYQALGLSPAQTERLDDLILAQNWEKIKLMAAAEAQGLDRSAPEAQGLAQQLREKYAAARDEILGPTAGRQFDRLVLASLLLDDIVGLVAESPNPLNGAQATQLLQILGKASGLDPVTAQANTAAVRWDEALQNAQDVLDVSQLAALKVESQLAELARLNQEFHRRQGLQNSRAE